MSVIAPSSHDCPGPAAGPANAQAETRPDRCNLNKIAKYPPSRGRDDPCSDLGNLERSFVSLAHGNALDDAAQKADNYNQIYALHFSECFSQEISAQDLPATDEG
jgi:hypothetical protein